MGAPTDRQRQEQTDADKTSPVQGLNERGRDGMAKDSENGAGQDQATVFGIPIKLDPDEPQGILEITQWDEDMQTGVVIAAIDLREPRTLLSPDNFSDKAEQSSGFVKP